MGTVSDLHGNMTSLFEHFDLRRETANLQEQRPATAGVSSKMLFKNADKRIVLLALKAGAKMAEHHADGTLSVQVLNGTIQFHAEGKTHYLPAGHLFTLAASVPHSVTASEDAVFLLTLSWPRDPELRSMPHRGYGT